VLEEDGTEIDEDVEIMDLAGSTFILLEKDQRWSSASAVSATPTSVHQPESTTPPQAPSEDSHPPSQSTSNTPKKNAIVI